MRRFTVPLIVCLLVPVAAEGQSRGRGPTPLGRQGALWQTGQGLALEAYEDLQRELDLLDAEAWRSRALAWIRFDAAESESGGRLTVRESDRVLDVEAGRRASVEAGPERPPTTWTVDSPKRVPRKLKLTMTDVDETEVSCTLSGELGSGRGYLGVFLFEGQLLCMGRAEASSPDLS